MRSMQEVNPAYLDASIWKFYRTDDPQTVILAGSDPAYNNQRFELKLPDQWFDVQAYIKAMNRLKNPAASLNFVRLS